MHFTSIKNFKNVTKDISIAEGIQRLDFFNIYIAIGYLKMGQSLWKTI